MKIHQNLLHQGESVCGGRKRFATLTPGRSLKLAPTALFWHQVPFYIDLFCHLEPAQILSNSLKQQWLEKLLVSLAGFVKLPSARQDRKNTLTIIGP